MHEQCEISIIKTGAGKKASGTSVLLSYSKQKTWETGNGEMSLEEGQKCLFKKKKKGLSLVRLGSLGKEMFGLS